MKVKAADLQARIDEAGKDSNKLIDLQLQFEGRLDKKEADIQGLREEIVRLRDSVQGKDDAIKALSQTLLEKGEHNRRLTEKLTEVKNHQLKNHFLNEWYVVSKTSKKGPIEMLVSSQ